MGTCIIIIVLIIVVMLAVRSSTKHMRGEGGCCGGESVPKVKKQKIKQSIEVKKIVIEGMTCDNCRKRVENSLNSINQVNAKVNLKDKTATVNLGENTADEVLKEAIEKAGYKVVCIEDI